jgi:menaquinol-cytochrome c reductase cytochrome b/c subunit
MARLTARERREAYLREYSYQKKTGKSFFPEVILHDVIVNLFFVLLIVGLAVLWHATADGEQSGILGPLYEAKADAAVAIYDPRPDWYYFFLFQLLRVFDNPNLLLLGTIIIPSIWMGILITLPFIDRTRERRVSRRPIAIGFAGAMAILLLTLTWKGSSAPNIEGEATATGPGIAFIQQQACSSCHTLGPLGWGGNIGPNLTSAKPDYALVIDRVTNGGGGMPAFKGELTAAQIKCIATIVATVSEGGGAPVPQATACKDFA